ncbi:hypothetical protein T261_03143 [Streptomyces lydicus]|nr:hypothetical protein T261_03143 [Streptomyces lydicus]
MHQPYPLYALLCTPWRSCGNLKSTTRNEGFRVGGRIR